MIKLVKYFILISLFLTGCSGYEKLLKSSDYEHKFKMAMQYYEEEDYSKAATLFEQCQTVFKGTDKADTINYYLAKSYYESNDFIIAGYYFRDFAKTYPRSPFIEESEFLGAYCYYLGSARPSLDQQETYLALDAFELFMLKYPYSEKIPRCKLIMAEMRDKLVEKSFNNAKLYYDLGKYKASIIALRNSLNDYPGTKYREEIMYLTLKSRYLLAKASIESKKKERFQATVDEYYSFMGEFPESQYKKEVVKIYEESNTMLNN